MKSNKILISLVAILAIVLTIASVSAFASVTSVEVNGAEAYPNGDDIGVTASETLAVKVIFEANQNASDVRLKAWITGGKEFSATSNRFDVISGRTYSKLFAVQVPSDIDPSEDVYLYVTVEADNAELVTPTKIKLTAQRESYAVEILSVNINSRVQAGTNLAMDVVLKNRGSHLAEDTFVTASIPALGVEERAYFGDLSAVDQSDPDKEDAAERRMYLNIPSNAKPGVYVLQFEAFNGDATTTVTKKVAIVGASADSMVVTSSSSKTFAVGEKATYTVTLVNSGNTIKVYNVAADSNDENLVVSVDETTVAVPAGSSRTVKVDALASEAGKYTFTVDVTSEGDLVKSESFAANVQGSTNGRALSGNTAVVLTVVLAIIFVVLLVVLIVLLTRKPEKTQEFGESYY